LLPFSALKSIIFKKPALTNCHFVKIIYFNLKKIKQINYDQ